jgi:hypothetical protein
MERQVLEFNLLLGLILDTQKLHIRDKLHIFIME